MPRRLFEQHLRRHGCVLHRHGGSHDVWLNPATWSEAAVPRHREIKTGTAKAICKQLQIPAPTMR